MTTLSLSSVQFLILSFSQEIYRRIVNNDNNCSHKQGRSGLTFCGVAANRYQVITSIEAASEDLRQKRKREFSIREKNATKSVDTAPKRFTKKTNLLDLKPVFTITPAAQSKTSTRAETCPVTKTGKKFISTLPAELSAPFSVLTHEVPSLKSCSDSGDYQLHWAIIAKLPCTVCRDDVCEFLIGLKLRSVYAYYYSEVFSSYAILPSNLMDVYVQFDTEVGINAALLRRGESFHATVSADYIEAGIDNARPHKKNTRIKIVGADLRRVTFSEALWAEGLSLKLDGSFSKCQANLNLVKLSFPHYLFSTNPMDSLKKWDTVSQSSKCHAIDELNDLLKAPQVKSLSSSASRGTNYEINGLHLDKYQSYCSAGFTGMSCVSHIADYRCDPTTTLENFNTDVELVHVRNAAEQEAAQILKDLSVVLSDALLSSYSTIELKDAIVLRDTQLILDLAHRMSKVYLQILGTLKDRNP